MGMEDNYFLTGDGLQVGMMDAFYNNVRISPVLRPLTPQQAVVGMLTPDRSLVPEEKRSDLVAWIREAEETATEVPVPEGICPLPK